MTATTNEQFLHGLGSHGIHDEKFEFNLDSEEDEDEVFIGDNICFKEKCQSAVVNDLCDFEPIAELTDEQWAHMKEQADLMVFLLWEDKKNFSDSPAAAATVPTSRNIIQSPHITSSPAMSTRSKRKMQLISNSPYKVSPLQDITNRSIIKSSSGGFTPQSKKKLASSKLDPLASSKLDPSTDMIPYELLGLVNPMRLNFDDFEHSPKKSRCLEPSFISQDTPLITDEDWNGLLSSPDIKPTISVRDSLSLYPRMNLDAKLMKSRIRSKTVTLDESSIILPSRPSISGSDVKESKTLCKNKEKSRDNNSSTRSSSIGKSTLNESFTVNDSSTCNSTNGKAPLNESSAMKSPRKSLLNVSFTIDKSSQALLGVGTPIKSSETAESSQGITEKPTLNESFTVNKSQCRASLNGKPALNESFTINKSYASDFASGRPSLNESFTINKSIVRDSIIGKSTLNESFTVNNSSTRGSLIGKPALNESFTVDDSSAHNSMNGKAPLNESSTINKSIKGDSVDEKPVLNESFTVENVGESLNEQPALNESFTIDDSQSVKPPGGKPVLNESFTINKSERELTIENSAINESFTMNKSQLEKTIGNSTLNESQHEATIENSAMNESIIMGGGSLAPEVLNKKPALNESFTLEKSPQNASFTVDSSIDHSLLDKSSTKVGRTTSKKKSPPEKTNSNSPLLDRSVMGNKSSRKRTLASVMRTPTRPAEPPSKTTVVSRSELNKPQVPTIKSSIGPRPTLPRPQLSKTNFTLKSPDMDFNASTSILQKDKHGMVKFEEKSMVPAKKPKSNLLLPNKLTRKSLKVLPSKDVPQKVKPKEQSPVLNPKRKCIQSTPPISKIRLPKPVSSLTGTTDVPKSRLLLPSKLPSNIGKPMSQSKIPNKGPLKAFPTFGKVSEIKASEGSQISFAGKSRLRMPSPVKSRIPHMNFKSS